ncbi:hypothetical protein [Actinacidiphila soli]|uniref:hypothetical protein n=1 Tax=Actinacidiphila soli TaxID=2487275 RepID=UPI000FCABD15|nr:hypothetical protein [Actinacidiphila soli]
MRISNLAATAIAASLAGSLTLGVAGVAGAAIHAPSRVTVVADEATAAKPAADVIAKLGDTLTYGAKLSQEAMAQTPDVSKLWELQRSLNAAAEQLTTTLGQAAAAKPADKPAADKPAADQPAMPADRPAEATQGHYAATPIDDAMAKVNDQLKALTTDVTELVAAVGNKDAAKVTSLVPKILGHLTSLATSVPTILTSLLGGVLPGLPIALDNDPNQQSAPSAPQAPEVPQAPAAPIAPQAPEQPNAPENAFVPQAPQAPQVPQAPAAPIAPQAPEQPNAPENAFVPQAPQAPEAPQAPQAPQDHQAPAAPQAPAADQLAPAAPVAAPQLNAPQTAELAESTG